MPSRPSSRPADVPRLRGLATVAVVAATFALASAISLIQWRTLAAPSWDLGIFTQLADAYAHLRAPIVPIKGDGFNLLGDHFHPILILLGPIYRLAPSALTLLMVQNVLFAFAAGALTYRLARTVPLWAATCLGALLGLGWGTQTAVAAQFHEVAFALPFLVFSLTAYLAERPIAAAAWIAPLVFVKEDLGLTVAVLGAIMVARAYRSRRRCGPEPAPPALSPSWRRAGLFLLGWGTIWFLVTVAILLPALNPHGQYDYTDRLESSGSFALIKLLLLGLLALTAGLIGLASPLILLAVPTIAWRFAGNVEFYWWIGWHYDVILMPIMLAALVDAARRYRPALARGNRLLAVGIALSASATLLVLPHLPVVTVVGAFTTNTSADSRLATASRIDSRLATASRIQALMAPDDVVVTDLTLMARLVPTARVYWIAERGISPDFVVIDTTSSAFSRSINAAAWAEKTYGGAYRIELAENGFEVARRVS